MPNQSARAWAGGSFAPPLSDELLDQYAPLINQLDERSQIRDAMLTLYNCCRHWWGLPESTGGGKPHPVFASKVTVVDLDPSIAASLWEHIPWDDELEAMGKLFESIDGATQKPLRDAAFHLLWHVKELALDREPLTIDRV